MNIQEMRENAMAGKWTTLDTLATLDDLQRLQEADRWIPVSERLPEEEGMYLVHNGDGTYIETYESFNSDTPLFSFCVWTEDGGHFEDDEVTHWRPLPQPPEEQE